MSLIVWWSRSWSTLTSYYRTFRHASLSWDVDLSNDNKSFWNIHNNFSLNAPGTLVFSNLFQEGGRFWAQCNDRIFSYRVLSCLRLKNTIFHVESLDQQSVNATSSPLVTRKQLLLVLNCNSHLSCPFV